MQGSLGRGHTIIHLELEMHHIYPTKSQTMRQWRFSRSLLPPKVERNTEFCIQLCCLEGPWPANQNR
jgi:hypothetical protein